MHSLIELFNLLMPIPVALLSKGQVSVFEPYSRHRCSSHVFVMCCVGSGPCDGLITHSGESYRVGVSNFVWSRNPKTRRPGPELGCRTVLVSTD